MSHVSVILPTFNRRATLPRAIRSVLQQSHAQLELIIVDDGSTDGTSEVLEEYSDSRIQFMRLEQNSGASRARNYGLSKAKYDLLAFQDSDDEWFPDKLAAAIAALNAEVGVVYHDVMYIKLDGTQEVWTTPDDVPFEITARFETAGRLGLPWCLFRTELVKQAGAFEESLVVNSDVDLLLRMRKLCSFRRVPHVLMNYYQSADALSGKWRERSLAIRRLIQLHYGELSSNKEFIAKALIRSATLMQKADEEERGKVVE